MSRPQDEGTFVDRNLQPTLFGIFIVLAIGMGFLMGPQIEPNNPDINNNIKSFTHDELRDLSIKACNQGWSPHQNSGIAGGDYSPTLALELKQLNETECP